ncbi:Acetyltransferase, GNAT family [Nitrospirillum viridazoti Y2]|uniref:Ribosomal protein S18 acetylase RimI-like enzyme n=1 Tax=Nitrospirillum amazonense TaxID=28077 RepID=A0A560HTF1_9PROT|nr:N-acetyltransferase [Nitrospirillum amazonense]EGY00060.1 Acetyltransferase, GNAT family [Nitrospirillum amazonense Y2]TWB49645.1 ribosomal protein S18 acetylase RimI-like enzyme [Nitrospirillum amazonense]
MTGAHQPAAPSAQITVEVVERIRPGDMDDLCDAADLAIRDGGGFGWVTPPAREAMERYWKGVMVVPERTLLVGRLDGVIAGSAQLVRPTRNNEAQSFACTLTTSFVAPWGRGHGLARALTLAVEEEAREAGFRILNLDVRATQGAAIALYRALGYIEWGHHPHYARVDGRDIPGLFFYKDLTEPSRQEDRPQDSKRD